MRERAIGVGLAVLGALFLALPQLASRVLLQEAASARASARVDAALERNQDSFLLLSATKAGLAVVEGSAVGVGFDLQVGDIVQPVYDLVHFVWRMFLFSFLVLGAYKLLMETGVLVLGFVLLGAALALWGASWVVPDWRARLRGAARGVGLLGLLIAYLVPLALLLTHWLSATYTADLKERYRADVVAFGATLDAAQESLLSPTDAPPWYEPGEKLDAFRKRLLSAARTIADAFDASLLSFSFYTLLVLIDYLVFPFLSAYVIYRLARLALMRLAA